MNTNAGVLASIIAPEQVVASTAPHHDGHPFPVDFDDEAKGVAPGMGLAHVVVLILELPESPEFLRLPDWSYLEHGPSLFAH